MVAMGGIFGGFQLDTRVVNPPAQAVGVCLSPAVIQGDSCVSTQCNVDQQGQQHCVSFPGGYIITGPNVGPGTTTSTSTTCTGVICVGVNTQTTTTSRTNSTGGH